MDNDDIFNISEETVAAWLDGNLSPELDSAFLDLLSEDPQLAEIMDSYEDIESDYEQLIEDGYEIPAEFQFDFSLPIIDETTDFNNVEYNNHHLEFSEQIDDSYSHEKMEDSDELYGESYDSHDEDIIFL